MRFDYWIPYEWKVDNKVEDALSRVQGSEILCLAISIMNSDLVRQIHYSYNFDSALSDFIPKLQQGTIHDKYKWKHDFLIRKGNIMVGLDDVLRRKII